MIDLQRIKHIQATTWVFLIVAILVAIPMYAGYSALLAGHVSFTGALVWEDAKETKQVNPYEWKWTWQSLGKNRWFAFLIVYTLWLISPLLEEI